MSTLVRTQPNWFLDAVVAGGEDFQLLAAVDPAGLPEIYGRFLDAGLPMPAVIGEFVPEPGVRLMPDNLLIHDAGFRHGEPTNRRRT
jgi:thiamine monophosphate kinase